MNLNPEMQEEIVRLGHLKNAAAAIVDYVRAVSPESDFKPCNAFYDWQLKPDTWIHLSFSFNYPTVRISLAVQLGMLPDHTGLKAELGRRDNWSRLYLKSAKQLPVVFKCIEYAYSHSSNKHGKRHG